MGKNYLMLAATSVLLFAACNNDDDVIKNVEADNSAQEIVLKVANSGDGLVTRAARPLYSSAAAQNIDNVKVIIRDASNQVVYQKTINNWMTTSTAYTTDGHGQEYRFKLQGTDKLAAGTTYKITAIGYSASTYTFTPDITGTLAADALTGNISATGSNKEVFAGENTNLKVKDDGSIFEAGATLTLRRQVAGTMGYFKNIPANINGKKAAKLRLVATAKNQTVTFENFNSDFTTQDLNVKYIVNGSGTATHDGSTKFNDGVTNGYILYEINLSDWFTAGAGGLDINGDGILDKNDTWKNAIKASGSGTYHGVKGSVFAGDFVIPFGLVTGKNTMELQLLDGTGAIIRYWNISISTAHTAQEGYQGEAVDASTSIFNVVRNHMYNVGVKANDGNPDTGNPTTDPDNPTPGIDDPEDLSKGQSIILKVNDNWETLHQLVVD